MTDLSTLLDRNQAFAEQFDSGDLPVRARVSTMILTCLDSRVDPAHFFGLELGDAFVMRNAGGWVTPAVLRELAILGVFRANLPGAAVGPPGLAVIHHTDCGMARLVEPTIQHQVAERLGIGTDEVAAMAITDPATSVRDEIERLRHTTGTPDQLVVTGLVYDVTDGMITEVVPSAPLRVAT